MMWSLLDSLYAGDQRLFNWFYRNYVGNWSGDFWVLLGNPFFWLPLWAFLALLLVLGRPKRSAYYVFIGFAAYTVTYQAAFVLSVLIGRMPPYQEVYAARGLHLAAYSFPPFPSLPDWASASLMAGLVYTVAMGKHFGIKIPSGIWLVLPLFFLGRVVPGYAFPLDVALGIGLGAIMAILFIKLAQHLPVVMGWRD